MYLTEWPLVQPPAAATHSKAPASSSGPPASSSSSASPTPSADVEDLVLGAGGVGEVGVVVDVEGLGLELGATMLCGEV